MNVWLRSDAEQLAGSDRGVALFGTSSGAVPSVAFHVTPSNVSRPTVRQYERDRRSTVNSSTGSPRLRLDWIETSGFTRIESPDPLPERSITALVPKPGSVSGHERRHAEGERGDPPRATARRRR